MKALAVLVIAGAALCAQAQGTSPTRPAAGGLTLAATRGLSLDEAVALVERRYHARVVRAETHNEGGHLTYVLRLLNESGRVWTVHVDAASGAIR